MADQSYFTLNDDVRAELAGAIAFDPGLDQNARDGITFAASLVSDDQPLPDEIPDGLDISDITPADLRDLAPEIVVLAVEYFGLDDRLTGHDR